MKGVKTVSPTLVDQKAIGLYTVELESICQKSYFWLVHLRRTNGPSVLMTYSKCIPRDAETDAINYSDVEMLMCLVRLQDFDQGCHCASKGVKQEQDAYQGRCISER
jgi:hypothetical protein